jgi:hypothetical protein
LRGLLRQEQDSTDDHWRPVAYVPAAEPECQRVLDWPHDCGRATQCVRSARMCYRKESGRHVYLRPSGSCCRPQQVRDGSCLFWGCGVAALVCMHVRRGLFETCSFLLQCSSDRQTASELQLAARPC